MSYKPKVLTVPEGGLGVSSLSSNALVCGGITSTDPVQQVSGLGTNTYVMTSNGPGVLPSWQPASAGGGGGYSMFIQALTGNPLDATTYYMCNGFSVTHTQLATVARARLTIPAAGTINSCYGYFNPFAGSNENVTLALRLNNTTDFNVSTTLQFNSANVPFNATGLGISVSAGDYILIKLICPTWATNPTTVSCALTFLVQ